MIRIKSIIKAFGGTIVVFCACFVTYLFQSLRLDLQKLDISEFSAEQKSLYDAQINQSNIMLAVALGILGTFAVITLFFSISKYIKENQQNMGILKAMGYKRERIAVEFTKFSINAFLGALLAIIFGVLFQKIFYQEVFANSVLPTLSVSYSPILLLTILLIPSLVFAVAAFLIAFIKLSRRPLEMIKGGKTRHNRTIKEKKTYLKTLRSTMLKNHISLVIFVGFAALCFGASVQMSFSLNQFDTSPLFFWMMFLIGLLLGVSILYLAFGFTYSENREYISLMKGYGYYDKEIIKCLYGGYLLVSVIGFVIGTFYQFGLLKLIILVFGDSVEAEYNFSFLGLLYTLLIFIPIYLLINGYYFWKLKKSSIRDALVAE